jgi:hypothetical protein
VAAMSEATTSSDPDGVLVASMWSNAAAGNPLVRLTMTAPGSEGETVRAVSTSAEALTIVEDWLTDLGL